MRNLSLLARAAIVIGALFFIGAAAATFLPASPDGATCGTWVDPEWTDEAVDDLLDDWEGIYNSTAGTSFGQGLASEAVGSAMSIKASKTACDDALGTRRTISIVLLAGAVLVPAAVMFVGRGAVRPTSSTSAR